MDESVEYESTSISREFKSCWVVVPYHLKNCLCMYQRKIGKKSLYIEVYTFRVFNKVIYLRYLVFKEFTLKILFDRYSL